jgi:hypothetical protein
MRRLLLHNLVVGVRHLFAAPAAHADQTLATTSRPTHIAAGQRLVAFSSYDGAINAYRLMIARHGRIQAASVRPSPTPFDVDVGRTESGRAYLVFQRCRSGGASSMPRGCDIFGYDPDSHHENRYRASTSAHSEVHPTYWRGRIAFVRYYGSGDDARPIVYTRRARSSRPSQRLPGLPARRCNEGSCGAVSGTINELELYGEHLAQTAFTITHATYPYRNTEVRLVDVRSGRSEQIARRGSGLSGQQFLGASFVAGRLYVDFTCHGDPQGCVPGFGGIYRYRYSTGDWAKAPTVRQLSGFTVSGFGTFMLQTNAAGGCGPVEGPNAPCSIVLRVPEPDYRPVTPPR